MCWTGWRPWREGLRCLLFCFILSLTGSLLHAEEPALDVEVFVRSGCPHCEAAEQFLGKLQREHPALRIVFRDIAEDHTALQRLRTLAAERGIPNIGVPTFRIGEELIVGFLSPETTGVEIRAHLDRLALGAAAGPEGIKTAWFGDLRITEIGLPLFTVAIGLLDGFNPCSMWVLLFMLSLLAGVADRAKMLLIAGTFVAVEGLVYFGFMAAWLNVFLLIDASRISELILGSVGVAAGAINIKDFWWFRSGISLGIPAGAKPTLYARMRAILQAENVAAALIGTVLLAFLVQAVEFLCTAGFPALYTRILTIHRLDSWAYYGYLVLYNIAYMLDDIVVLAIGVITISHYRLHEREGRWLKLVSGLTMTGLGMVLLLRPKWLI